MPSSILAVLKDEGYKWGDCQILRYDSKRVDIFEEGYVSKLYRLCRGDSPNPQSTGVGRHGNILPQLFCGMSNHSHDALTGYLLQLPIFIPVFWTSPEHFIETGLGFLTTICPPLSVPSAERAGFAAYGFFRDWWGRHEISTLAMLGLAYIFNEFNLLAIHGIRYARNDRTARFMAQFGFRETGRVPRYQLQNGSLVEGVVSSLLIEDFEEYVAGKLIELAEGKAGGNQRGRQRRTIRSGSRGDAVQPVSAG